MPDASTPLIKTNTQTGEVTVLYEPITKEQGDEIIGQNEKIIELLQCIDETLWELHRKN